MLTYLLELIGPKWRHILARRMGVYDAMHDVEWLDGYCCPPQELTEPLRAMYGEALDAMRVYAER